MSKPIAVRAENGVSGGASTIDCPPGRRPSQAGGFNGASMTWIEGNRSPRWLQRPPSDRVYLHRLPPRQKEQHRVAASTALPFPVPALCSTPRGERASDYRDALRPDSARCAAAHRAGQGRRVLHAAAPQARGATRSAFYRASMASTPRSHPLRRPSTVALNMRSVTDYGAATL